MEIKQELQMIWKNIRAIAFQKGNKRFENVPCEWKTFDEFYKANYHKYYRAKLKWRNYKKVVPEKYYQRKTKQSRRLVTLIRKVKENGFTKTNIVFTSISDRMKYHKTSNRYMFDKGQLLGTRDVKNILTKRGIKRSMSSISALQRKNKSIFKINRLDKWKWKGVLMSLNDIATKEKITYGLLNNKIFMDGFDLNKAVEYCKNYIPPTYPFEGKMLYPNQIFEILSIRHGIKKTTLQSRFYKWGYNIEKMIINKSSNKYAPYPKKVIAKKGNEKYIFNSISETVKCLKLNGSAASNYLNGKLKNTNQTKGYELYFVNDLVQ